MKNYYIQQETIRSIKELTDIVEIISEAVVLKKRGKDFVGLCPFHSEKTPSFSVSRDKGLYYCFGCSAGGDVINFIMQKNQFSFSETVEYLATRHGVEIKHSSQFIDKKVKQQRDLHLEILASAGSFYQHILYSSTGKQARRHLEDFRQIDLETTVKIFQLGFAPDERDMLYHHLLKKGYSEQAAIDSGLLYRSKSGKLFDRFRNRLMFPIHDPQGRIIAFAGRYLSGGRAGSEHIPKYVNSSDTLTFKKGETLFGVHLAKKAIAQKDSVILVEGYLDAISLWDKGIKNVVSSMGTAVTNSQLLKALKYTPSNRIYFNFDGDDAGTRATEAAFENVLSMSSGEDVEVFVVDRVSPDPEEYLRAKGTTKYVERLTNAAPWTDWKVNSIFNDKDLDQIKTYKIAFKQSCKLLKRLPLGPTRSYVTSICAKRLSANNPAVEGEIMNTLLVQSQNSVAVSLNDNLALDGSLELFNSIEFIESLVLQTYLHFPQTRKLISMAFLQYHLSFISESKRRHWNTIMRLNQESLNSLEAFLYDYPLTWDGWSHYRIDSRPLTVAQFGILNLRLNSCKSQIAYCQDKLSSLSESNIVSWRSYFNVLAEKKKELAKIDSEIKSLIHSVKSIDR